MNGAAAGSRGGKMFTDGARFSSREPVSLPVFCVSRRGVDSRGFSFVRVSVDGPASLEDRSTARRVFVSDWYVFCAHLCFLKQIRV